MYTRSLILGPCRSVGLTYMASCWAGLAGCMRASILTASCFKRMTVHAAFLRCQAAFKSGYEPVSHARGAKHWQPIPLALMAEALAQQYGLPECAGFRPLP